MNSYGLIKLVSVLIAAGSQVLLKISANKKYDSVIKEYLNPLVIIAYGIFFASMLLSSFSLKGISISFSSIIESVSYILVPVFGYCFFKERIKTIQFVGMIVILIGMIIYNI